MDTNIEPLLKRVTLFLEDGDWAKADEYCERVLDQDPENAEAYLGKLLAELHVHNRAALSKLSVSFADNKNYQKALRYGDEALKAQLKVAETSVAATADAVKEMESKAKKKQAPLLIAIFGIAVVLTVIILFFVHQANLRAKQEANWQTIAAGCNHSVGIKKDGTVITTIITGQYRTNIDLGQCNVYDWMDIVAVAAARSHTVGLKKDGTVVAVGYNHYKQCDVSNWTNIVAVAAGEDHTVGLKRDGTVVAIGSNSHGQCDVSKWTGIVAITASEHITIGLKKNGTVVTCGVNGSDQCDVSDWKDIVAIAASSHHTVGLKADGTVVADGNNSSGECDVSDWTDIVAIAAGTCHTVGLKKDGTVVAAGYNESGACDVSGWTGIVAIAAGDFHTLGLKKDGRVVSTRLRLRTSNLDCGQCDVSNWKNIRVPGK